MTQDVLHADELREVLEDHGLAVDDIELRGIDSFGRTRLIIDGELKPGYEAQE